MLRMIISARLIFVSHHPLGQKAGRTMRHGIDLKEPIHNVKEARLIAPNRLPLQPELMSSSIWKIWRAREHLQLHRRSLASASFAGDCAPHNHLFRKTGGAYRDRTDDLMLAKQPLSQLS